MRWNTLDPEDEHYLEAIYRSDSEILRKLYRDWHAGIVRHVRASGGNNQDADDVFQDTMVVLYRKIRSGNLSLSSRLHTYFHGIAKKVWLKKRSRRKRNQSTVEEGPEQRSEDDVATLLEKTERYRFFREKLAQLGGDCRKVLNLFFAGESMENIAQALGYASAGYAKKRKFQCKKQLIGLIREDRRYEELSG